MIFTHEFRSTKKIEWNTFKRSRFYEYVFTTRCLFENEFSCSKPGALNLFETATPHHKAIKIFDHLFVIIALTNCYDYYWIK